MWPMIPPEIVCLIFEWIIVYALWQRGKYSPFFFIISYQSYEFFKPEETIYLSTSTSTADSEISRMPISKLR